MTEKFTGYLLLFLLSLIPGCSSYRVYVQGVDLDHFIASRPAAPDTREAKREAAYHNDLGVILEREGELESALEEYRIAREKDPDLVLAYVNAGNVLVRLDKPAEAEKLYRRALEREPDQTLALNNLAWVLILRGEDPAAAIELLERAIEVDPDNRYQYLDSLGWALYRDGRAAEALETLNDAVKETPPEETYLLREAHDHLYIIYRERGEDRTADEHLRKSRELGR